MAIRPNVVYPLQIDTSDPASYPYGAARNIVVPGDASGTPWEEQLVNDIFGFQQALLDAGGITPSDTPDKVGASDYLDALEVVIEDHPFSDITISDFLTVGGVFTSQLGAIFESTGFTPAIICDGAIQITGAASIGNGLAISAGGLTVGGNATVNGNLTVTGADNRIGDQSSDTTRVNGLLISMTALQSDGVASFAGLTQFNGQTTFSNVIGGTPTLTAVVTPSGAGRVKKRFVIGANADSSYGINDADVVFVNSLTADRAYTLPTTGAAAGDIIVFFSNQSGFKVTLNGVFEIRAGTAQRGVMLVFDGTSWVLVQSFEAL